MGPERLKNATVSLKPRGAALVAAMNVGLIRRGLRGGVRKKDIAKFDRFWDEMERNHIVISAEEARDRIKEVFHNEPCQRCMA